MGVTLTCETHVLPRAPEAGTEIVAIGDIHGRADLIDALLEAAAGAPKICERRALVFTGDLVDRGPRNLGAIALAREGARRIDADELCALMGNHEAMMRLSLDPEVPFAVGLDTFGTWLRNGGGEVVAEFAPLTPGEPLYPDEWLRRARAALPDPVLHWLRALRPHWRCGGLLFVHAGVHPAVDLETMLAAPWNIPPHEIEENRHWAWVRTPFLSHRPGPGGFFGYLVVHGHTPRDGGHAPRAADQIRRFRLNLDAGSYFAGEAKMALIRGAHVELFTAHGPTDLA